MLRKIQPGERLDGIPADAWNAFVDAALWVQTQQRSLRGRHTRNQSQTGIVSVKNSSGYDCSRFDVLGIDDWFPSPADNADAFKTGPVIHGVTPSLSDHRGRFVVLLEPCASGSICAGVVSGFTVAKVTMSDATDGYCEAKDGDRGSLQSAAYGSATILRVESGTGVKWAVVRLDSIQAAMVPAVLFHTPSLKYETPPNPPLDPTEFTVTDQAFVLWAVPSAGTSAGVTNLKSSYVSWGDPAFEIDVGGLWRIRIKWTLTVGGTWTSVDSWYLDDYTDSNGDTYQHWNLNDRHCRPTLALSQKPSGGSWTPIHAARLATTVRKFDITGSDEPTFNECSEAIVELSAGTVLRMITDVVDYQGSAEGAIIQTLQGESNIIFERLQTYDP